MERLIKLDGTCNTRDCGGYPTTDGKHTRWHMLIRSDAPVRLTRADRDVLARYGVRSSLDLRFDIDLIQKPSALVSDKRIAYQHIELHHDYMGYMVPDPVQPTRLPRTLDEYYMGVVTHCRPQIRRVMSYLARQGVFPVMLNCAMGKDRTGIIAGLLLANASVPDEIVAEDYALTAHYAQPVFDEYLAEVVQRGDADLEWERIMCGSPPEVMMRLLRHLQNEFGGVREFLLAIGNTADELAALRTTLIE